jgi:hypothetical protein
MQRYAKNPVVELYIRAQNCSSWPAGFRRVNKLQHLAQEPACTILLGPIKEVGRCPLQKLQAINNQLSYSPLRKQGSAR